MTQEIVITKEQLKAIEEKMTRFPNGSVIYWQNEKYTYMEKDYALGKEVEKQLNAYYKRNYESSL